jgi:riboflavin synthase
MFTGLVQAIGEVMEATPRPGGALRLAVRAAGWSPAAGDSICVAGVCLTLAGPVRDGVMAFDAVAETLAKTTLGGMKAGMGVNLERSLAAGDPMGGHTVQGHVDGIGVVERVQSGADYRVWVRPPAALMEYIVPKGSIAIDGVSLTVAGVDVRAGVFDLALIPTTLEKTTLGRLRAGDRCNLESDILARTVVHYLRHFAPNREGRAGECR